MTADDFRSNEKSVVIEKDGALRIELRRRATTAPRCSRSRCRSRPARSSTRTFMNTAALQAFLARRRSQRAKDEGVLFSVHLKATMMKVSDPIIFGHAVQAFFPKLFAEQGDVLLEAGLDPSNGLGGILSGAEKLGGEEGQAIEDAVKQGLADGPELAMVDSDKGITNLHVPSDVIVDASMPAMIRTSGHMWGPDGEEADTLAVIPDSSYAGIYQVVIDDCREHGAYDPSTMGSVPNVGLMARAAEEYGSHDKTFEIAKAGTVRVVDEDGNVLHRARGAARVTSGAPARPRTSPIRDWVKLAVTRARATGDAGDLLARRGPRPRRQPDREGQRVPARTHDTDGLDISIMAPGRRDQGLGRADPQGRGHHLGHRQRAARLPHRPVPDPRARHVGQDALRRTPDQRRWPLRDRRRRLGAQARAAAGQGELPALGQPR